MSCGQAVSQLPLTAEDRVRYQGNPREICGGQVALRLDWVSSSTVRSGRQRHSSGAPCSSLSTSCSYQKGKRKKTGKLSKGQWSFANRIALDRNVPYPVFKCSGSRSRDARHNSTLQNNTVPTANVAYKNWCIRWRPSALQNILTVAVGGQVQ